MRMLVYIIAVAAAAAVLAAPTANEVSCGLLTGGGGRVGAAQVEIIGSLGQDVVGQSIATGHSLRHGVWPCRAHAPSAVGDDVPGQPARLLRLLPNVPNPFNPATEIRYEVPAGANRVDLRVYDVSGRLVRTLVTGAAVPGRHRTEWRGTDDRGLGLSSGVYYAVLESGDQRLIRKMLLLK